MVRFVDGACIDEMPFEFVKEKLFGPPNTLVRLRLQRGKGPQASAVATRPFGGARPGELYEVTVRRHAMITIDGIRALHASNIAAKVRPLHLAEPKGSLSWRDRAAIPPT